MFLNPSQEREVAVGDGVTLKMSIFHSFSILISFGGRICVQFCGDKFQYLPPHLQEIKRKLEGPSVRFSSHKSIHPYDGHVTHHIFSLRTLNL